MRLHCMGFVLAPLVAVAACSGSTTTGDPSDAADAATCGVADDGRRPLCPRGDRCSCDDTKSLAPICANGTWVCPAGSTAYEDCVGIPPERSDPRCSGDAGDGGD